MIYGYERVGTLAGLGLGAIDTFLVDRLLKAGIQINSWKDH
jgi:hypothetical protein